MTLKTPTMYAIECDEPGCKAATEDLGEFSAWSDHGAAEDQWRDHDGIILKDGRHYCDGHRDGRMCDYCESEDDVQVVDDESLCVTHRDEAKS